MRRFRSLSSSTFLLGVTLVVGLLPLPLAHADETSDWKAVIALRNQIDHQGPTEKVSALQVFGASRQLDPILAAEVNLQIAEITRADLKKPDEAMALLEAGWQATHLSPDPAKPVAVMYLEAQSAALLSASRPAEAKKLLEANEALIQMAGKSGHAHMEQFASRALQRLTDAQDLVRAPNTKPLDTVALLKTTLSQMPVFLHPDRQKSITWTEGWMYERLIQALTQANRQEEALQWGKLYFAEAEYDQKALESATRLLREVWMSQGDLPKVRAFAKAQSEANANNPLAKVTFPVFEATATLTADLLRLRQQQAAGSWRGRQVPIISLEIAQNNWVGAIKEALAMLRSEPLSPDGPEQIARVLKAKDASVVRANQFLASLEGESPNPVPAFLREAEDQEDAAQ